MPIFRSIGFGIFIAILALLLPDVLSEGRATAISFLRAAHLSADVGSAIVAGAAAAPTDSSAPLPRFTIPQAPTIPSY